MSENLNAGDSTVKSMMEGGKEAAYGHFVNEYLSANQGDLCTSKQTDGANNALPPLEISGACTSDTTAHPPSGSPDLSTDKGGNLPIATDGRDPNKQIGGSLDPWLNPNPIGIQDNPQRK